jgi:hypothetical protein
MHVVATNICVWIRTLVLESLKEITAYHTKRGDHPEDGIILGKIHIISFMMYIFLLMKLSREHPFAHFA